jgi:hypothetical protein
LKRLGNSRWALALPQIGLEPLEDFPSFQIEQAQADRAGRPSGFDRLADRAGGVRGFDLGFGKNGRAEIDAEAEELKPEALKSHGEDAFELVQWINLEKTDGGTHAQLPTATRDVGVQLRPGRWFAAAQFVRPPSDKVRHLAPMGGGFRRRCSPLALARLGKCADSEGCDQLIGVGQGSFGDLDVDRRASARWRRHEPANLGTRPSSVDGHL